MYGRKREIADFFDWIQKNGPDGPSLLRQYIYYRQFGPKSCYELLKPTKKVNIGQKGPF